MPRTPSLNPKPKRPSATQRILRSAALIAFAVAVFVLGLTVAVLWASA